MKRNWWKEGVIYQIYPRSFNDSNNDGIGDIQGVIQKLDYIQSLGVDIIWLCPVYDSPNDDNGYDIRDYYSIMEEFGTMADFDQLLNEAHQRGMKLIMDLVVNHTSDEHEWFVESQSSKNSDKRDFYYWKDGVGNSAPNNWGSFFSGSAWDLAGETDQYYLHLFTKKQPDLNWENEAVRKAVYDMMNWWLSKGIDGFRMDVISLISKRDFEDSPYESFNDTIANKYANGPRVTEFLEEMVASTVANYDVMTVGEGPGITFDKALNYVDENHPRLNMVFHFDHMFMDQGEGGKFDPIAVDFLAFKKVFAKWDELVTKGGWPAIFLGNHDFPRIVSRFGNDGTYRELSAKALALMLLTLRGTSYIYQGDEIGMTNVPFNQIDDYRDIETINAHKEWLASGKEESLFISTVKNKGRDNARTPIQWDDSANGGFSIQTPWINSNPNYDQINVAAQQEDPNSILNFYRKAIKVRKENKDLVYGDFSPIQLDHPSVFAYERTADNNYLILLNFSEENQSFDAGVSAKEMVLSNYNDTPENQGTNFNLRPWEGVLFKA